MDFTLGNNEKIKKYFEGDNSDPPISELIYLHGHPLLRPNFLTQIEEVVGEAADKIRASKVTGAPIQRYLSLVVELGMLMPDITQENGLQVLSLLRDILDHSKSIIKSLNDR